MKASSLLKMLMAVLLVMLAVGYGAKGHGTSQSRAPAVGNLNGVYVSIPTEYQFFAVNYVGENEWAGKRLKEPATLDAPIQSFGIRVRSPDMVPISPATQKDWIESDKHSPFYPWIVADIMTTTYSLPYEPWDHKWLEGWGRYTIRSKGCRYEKQNEKRFGLAVEKLVCSDPEMAKNHSDDLMYDENDKMTVIICDTQPLLSPKGRHSCEHRFPIYEMNAVVSFRFYPEHLEDWKANQEKIKMLLKSFVVDKH